jgi:hypothetical protein
MRTLIFLTATIPAFPFVANILFPDFLFQPAGITLECPFTLLFKLFPCALGHIFFRIVFNIQSLLQNHILSSKSSVMKPVIYALILVASLGFSFVFYGCKKNTAVPTQSPKYQIVTGTWKQTDIVLGVDVSVNVGGNSYNFPSGTSMITNPYLQAFGVAGFFAPTVNNVYQFDGKGSYSITGPTDLIMPAAGNAGTWKLDVYDAVLKLNSSPTINDPHWINAITSDSLSLSMTVDIPGLGTAPLNLLLHKQQ